MYSFIKNSSFTHTQQTKSFSFRTVSVKDSGTYKCLVKNSIGWNPEYGQKLVTVEGKYFKNMFLANIWAYVYTCILAAILA